MRQVARWLAAGVMVLSVVDGVFGQRGLIENRRLAARNEATTGTVDALQAENTALAEQSRRLKEDPSAIEDLARRDLGLMKPGELLVIVRDVPAPTPTSPSNLRQDRTKR